MSGLSLTQIRQLPAEDLRGLAAHGAVYRGEQAIIDFYIKLHTINDTMRQTPPPMDKLTDANSLHLTLSEKLVAKSKNLREKRLGNFLNKLKTNRWALSHITVGFAATGFMLTSRTVADFCAAVLSSLWPYSGRIMQLIPTDEKPHTIWSPHAANIIEQECNDIAVMVTDLENARQGKLTTRLSAPLSPPKRSFLRRFGL